MLIGIASVAAPCIWACGATTPGLVLLPQAARPPGSYLLQVSAMLEPRRALSDRWLAFIPALAGLLVFLPALRCGFVYDDHVDVAQVDDVFTPGAWPHLFVTATAKLYRPFKYLSFYAENA